MKIKVISEVQTCFACPTQWEGELSNGQSFYFRYRHGVASLGLGEDVHDAIMDQKTNSVSIGGGLDGFLDYDDYRETMGELLQARGLDA